MIEKDKEAASYYHGERTYYYFGARTVSILGGAPQSSSRPQLV